MAFRKSFTGRDVGIDLGTANTLVYVRGKGIVLNEPSVVAVSTHDGSVLAVGAEARDSIGRTPSHIVAVRPLRDGVIADFDIAERMLRHFVKKVTGRRGRLRLVVCVPSGVTDVERRAVIEAATQAGAHQVQLVQEPLAAALGAGLPVGQPTGCMVVDIGGGTTEVAVLSLGGIVTARSVRTAGNAMDAAIIAYAKKRYSLTIGERTAEQIKVGIGSAAPDAASVAEPPPPAVPSALADSSTGVITLANASPGAWREEPAGGTAPLAPVGTVPDVALLGGGERGSADGGERGPAGGGAYSAGSADVRMPSDERCVVRGRDQVSGMPKVMELSADEVRYALAEPVAGIVEAVRTTLDETPPELAGDIMDRGIVLTGGGALLRGLDARLGRELNIPVLVADDPLDCVAVGTGRCVEDSPALRGLGGTQPWPSAARMA
ncbi:rod shape-determining protein [Streptomyces sp. B1866]|uniref:rod shape-determining protein n=1 Tax=Streptomyces sp. B1866 TaxID=3075431 RepID=UPI00289257B3|nr:rod shape-determining protein [Streptomyces sp. B1866]MDT3397575.1 rod shape-determining protein [Streptomyces sp. B1866]